MRSRPVGQMRLANGQGKGRLGPGVAQAGAGNGTVGTSAVGLVIIGLGLLFGLVLPGLFANKVSNSICMEPSARVRREAISVAGVWV